MEPLETAVKERPMRFSGAMVRAILDGMKTQTRRVVKTEFEHNGYELRRCSAFSPLVYGWYFKGEPERNLHMGEVKCPHGAPGWRLWIKETFGIPYALAKGQIAPIEDVVYRANPRDQSSPLKWKPSIFMRRQYSRITLEITVVRVERLNSISEADAKAEGVEASKSVEMKDGSPCYSLPYRILWDQIHGCDSWEKNPWIWVLEFNRV